MILESKDLNKCYGCFACANICPKNCIELKQNEEGFFMPEVDRSACINCGLCDKVCIIGKTGKDLIDHKKRPACYYGFLKDDALRKRSASGGLAYALSAECIKNGGVVFGVVGKWFENVHHVKAETLEQLEEICGSKYVQSQIGNMYTEAKEELERGKTVLFTGTPCQIAGLYSYLGKDYDNLLTADLMCHGVPSQKVLKAEIAEKEKQKGKIKWLGRSNKYQFAPSQYIINYESGAEEVINETGLYFRKAFVANLIQRKSCNNCMFSQLPRVGDISMGDIFIGFGKKPLSVMDPKNIGVSSVVVNSPKGKHALNKISNIFEYGPMTLERTILSHNTLAQGIIASPRRAEYFELLQKNGFAETTQLIDEAYYTWKSDKKKKNLKSDRELKRHPIQLIKRIINKAVEWFI